jgi:hypothetical protein
MNKHKKHKYNSLPIGTINAATGGDPDAVHAVVRHYDRYIRALSVVRLFDEDGTPYIFINEDLRRELELRLITKVVGFKFKPA